MELSGKVCCTREEGVDTFRELLSGEVETTPRALCAVKTLIFFLKGSKNPTISQANLIELS